MTDSKLSCKISREYDAKKNTNMGRKLLFTFTPRTKSAYYEFVNTTATAVHKTVPRYFHLHVLATSHLSI